MLSQKCSKASSLYNMFILMHDIRWLREIIDLVSLRPRAQTPLLSETDGLQILPRRLRAIEY